MKKHFFRLALWMLLGVAPATMQAQRIQQPLGRGVVTVKNGNDALISWRKLAQESETVQYNVYVNGKKLNAEPLNNTHYKTTSGQVPSGAEVTVTLINNGVESSPSNAHKVGSFDVRNMFMSIRFDASPLTAANFSTNYVWPVDLDGDGEMDYVVNRKNNSTGLDNYVEAYLSDGTHLWTVKLGPNELSCAGQDDMILAYDMDCDGKGDVVVQTSDGTQFWDNTKKDFGLYVNGSTTGDTDGDGIIDYETQSKRNAPRYMTVVDGMTGREKCSVEQTYNDAYSRGNKASLMGDEYNKHVGHVGVFYPDGIHPAVIMEWHTRFSDGSHIYYNSAFSFDFSTGKAGAWKELFCKRTGGPAFHQIRIVDVDGDGRDEMQTGGYTMDDNGNTLNTPGIAHGDRFRTSDIDPERPGLETYAIQQNAGDMLGQILYDAGTGKSIKKWYLSAVGDVGRGECMDVDPNHLGWELWSTMGGVYNAKGDLIPDYSNPYPTEGIWWDDELDREIVQSSDSHYNVYIQDFFKGRLFEIAKASDWRYVTVYAKRAAFWGDIVGDWREELVLLHKENGVCVGIVGFSTDYTTKVDNIYCLQEDPAYRGQCTTKGYYQSPNTGFYLGYDMPRPQLPPCMVTDLVWKSSDTFTDYNRSTTLAYADGKSLLMDLNTESALTLNSDIQPAIVYAMPVKGQTITLSGSGKLAGTMELWKSQQGTLVVNTPLVYGGQTVVSEGTLEVNGEIKGNLSLRARGTLAGNAVVNNIAFEGALNYEGGRLAPGALSSSMENPNGVEGFAFGTITFNKGLKVANRTYMEMDVKTETGETDLVKVQGDFDVQAPVIFTIRTYEQVGLPGKFKLIEYTGTFSGSMDNFSVRGLTGLSYDIVNENNTIYLVINEQRKASNGVVWTGVENNQWDYKTKNFKLGADATEFVAGDGVEFGDDAATADVVMESLMPISAATINNQTKEYTFSGTGGFSGTGSLTKVGEGKVNLNSTKSDYTGATIIKGGSVLVKELADGGMPSSIGAATSSPSNWQLGKATLIVDNSNTSTNRGLTLTDSANIQILSGATALKGVIEGTGMLVKTGSGQLNLNAVNKYTGGTYLHEGSLAQGAYTATFGALGSPIAVKNGTITIFDVTSVSTVPNFNYAVNLLGGKLVLNAGSRCYINGSFSGEGTIDFSIPYVRTDMLADWADFNGTLNVSGSDFRLCKAIDFSGTTINLTGSTIMGHYKSGGSTALDATTKIGALASSSTTVKLLNGNYEVGYNNKNATFSGLLSNVNVAKYGKGSWTLTNTGGGAIDIYDGYVYANSLDGQATGTATVHEGGVLAGQGSVRKVVLEKGGTLAAGKISYSIGTFSVTTSITSEGGATLYFKINKSGNDMIKANGAITLPGDTLHIQVINRTLEAGEEFQLFDNRDRTLDAKFTITPAVPGEGLVWDTTRLLTEGIIRVADASGIHAIGKSAIQIYPQLVDDHCYIDATQACTGELEMQLLDANGRILQTGQFDASTVQTVSMDGFSKGIYFIRLTQDGESKVTRVVKVK